MVSIKDTAPAPAGDSMAPAGGDDVAPEHMDDSEDNDESENDDSENDDSGESPESCVDHDEDPCLGTDIDSPDAHSPAPAPAATVGGDDSPVGEKIALVHPDGS